MAFKSALLVCALALSVQNAYSQVGYGNFYGPSYGVSEVEVAAVDVSTVGIGSLGAAGLGGVGFGGAGLGSGMSVAGLGATSSPAFLNLNGLAAGGVLPISSIGPVIPAGLTVLSDNAIEGTVSINGQLPFLSAVAFEGSLPSAGSGVSQCGCGTSNIGILSEIGGKAAGVSGAGLTGVNGMGGLGLNGFGGLGLIL